MHVRVLLIAALIFMAAVSGCASSKRIDSSPDAELKSAAPVPGESAKAADAAAKDVPATGQKAAAGGNAAEEINDFISALNREIERERAAAPRPPLMPSAGATQAVGPAVMVPAGKAPASQAATLKESAGKEMRSETEKPPPAAVTAGVLKVKVLSGNGDISSAKKMSRRLGKMGYRIRAVDMAPSKHFKATTIFYASGYEEEARRMAGRLGGGTICKRLTWKSVYHLIVVTGK